ncbi:MAG: anti-sigma factor family protein [Aridibacter sp.]
MKCIDIEQKLNELLDGELGLSEKATVETHLESCDSCQTQFENMQAISGNMKQNLVISAPSLLDEKMMNAFQNFQNEKLAEIPTEKTKTQKIGWFGIPKFAFAAALLLFGLVGITAFQIGKISASEVSIIMPQVQESKVLDNSTNADFAENKQPNVGNVATTKIIEVPVIKEKIVEVPVIKEKIVTRVVYRNTENKNVVGNKENLPKFSKTKEVASTNGLKDNEFSTQINLKGFQLVSELKPQIIKGEKNEK